MYHPTVVSPFHEMCTFQYMYVTQYVHFVLYTLDIK
jgi:hypothetical protein